jgi:glyoxylase-like metal-dependent hydrolase (beta-lactamase superfamily II)
MLNRLLRIAGCTIALTLAADRQTLLAQPPVDGAPPITRIRGDLYRVQNGGQTSVFLATTDGILLVDPLSVPFARRLKAELDMRFPGVPVKYVVYSMLDVDRVSGAGVFSAAQLVAHESLNARLPASRRALPRGYAAYDRNANMALEADELAGVGNADSILSRDLNRDGHVTPEDLWSQTLDPDSVYATSRVITLGAERVELVYTGLGTGIGATAIYFQNERLLFVGDHPPLTAPFADRAIRPKNVTVWARTVAQRDFEVVLAGNGDELSREQVTALDRYARALMTGVADGLASGRTIEQIQRDPTIDSFAGTPFAGSRNARVR